MWRRKRVLQDLGQEIRDHLAMATQENIDRGMSHEEARYSALRKFGNVTRVKEDARAVWGWLWLEALLQDVRFGIRTLCKTPAFTAIVILTLALGIGAATAVFSVVDRVLFRSLPYPSDDRLVSFGVKAPFEGIEFMLAPEYVVLRRQPGPFESMTSLTPGGADCDITEQSPVRLSCALVEGNFLSTLGIHPIVGRDFTREDDLPKAPRVALLSYSLWQARFAGDPKIAGKMMSLDGKPVEIIGALPASFEMPNLGPADILLPQAVDEAAQDRTHPQLVLRTFARLKPSVTIAQATAGLQPWFQDSLRFVPPQFRLEVSLCVRSLRDRQVEDSRVGAWVLLGAVIAVLLLACTNVANLLLVRGAGRQRELAVRAALGATRKRLACQTLTAEQPVILSEALANKMFPNEDPLGKSLRFGAASDSPSLWRTIVGVAADVKNNGLIADADPEFYIPWKNDSQAYVRRSYVTFLTSLSSATVVPWARSQIAAIDPTTPVEFSTMTDRIGKLTERPRFDATLLSLFAGVAVLLASLGIYGVVSFFVSQRTQEIGVRMALGATPLSILKMVLFNVARWAVTGAILGILGSWFCARLLQSLLFEVRPHDPVLLTAALLVLLTVTFFAAWIPARRAARVDPMIALRYE